MPETGQEIIDKIAKEAGGITIPEPLQKGILKAANRLLGGAIDVPAAWLEGFAEDFRACLLYTSPSPRDRTRSRMPSSA